jgi:eukaryotic translation initiation factor 2C
MVYNLLQKFNKVDGATSTGKPQRIIFYRDGVSEDSKVGCFNNIHWLTLITSCISQDLERELSAILRACKKLDTDYKPPVTFIVVQKNHHTTLFPEDEKDEVK